MVKMVSHLLVMQWVHQRKIYDLIAKLEKRGAVSVDDTWRETCHGAQADSLHFVASGWFVVRNLRLIGNGNTCKSTASPSILKVKSACDAINI